MCVCVCACVVAGGPAGGPGRRPVRSSRARPGPERAAATAPRQYNDTLVCTGAPPRLRACPPPVAPPVCSSVRLSVRLSVRVNVPADGPNNYADLTNYHTK